MPDWIRTLFDSQDFMPHGHCFLWEPEILWLHVVSDVLVGLAYFSIPATILFFARKRTDLPFRSLYVLFGLFIVLCGTTHFMSVWVLWNPDYGIEGIIKAFTAVASISTAVLVWRLLPKALTLPSPAKLQVMNEQLKENNLRTEREVEKRTAELRAANELLQDSERKLQFALSEARAASRAKSEFLTNMSHEIRTPMNAIVGLTTYLSWTEGLSERQKECIRTMEVSAAALMDLINDLLDISKIEMRQIEMNSTPFNLRTLLNEVITIMAPRAKEKNLELNLLAPQDMPEDFMGDAARIRQVLLNLLGNAVKFTAYGSVTLTVTVQPAPSGQTARIVMEVADTGIGIPLKNLPHIFEKFTQGDSSIKRKYGGSGLGLAIAHSFVTQMGGHIDVTSQPEKGSRFTITLILPTAPTEVPMEPILLPKEQPPAKNKGRLLIVEDWQPNILVASVMLEVLGYNYDVARSSEEAEAMFEANTYDAVLMDIQLPNVNGYEVTRRLREMEKRLQRRETPIIATTAYAMKGDREKCLTAGMDDYLAKPLDTKSLGRVLQNLIKPRVTI